MGLKGLREQAEQAKSLFSERKQIIKSFKHLGDQKTEIEIAYHAVLAIDLPNGTKKGDVLDLEGRSIFMFSDDKIVELTDISQHAGQPALTPGRT